MIVYPLLSPWTTMLGFKNCDFAFHGLTLVSHQVMPVTGQSVAFSLVMLHFWIDSDGLGPWLHHHLTETLKLSRAEGSRYRLEKG